MTFVLFIKNTLDPYPELLYLAVENILVLLWNIVALMKEQHELSGEILDELNELRGGEQSAEILDELKGLRQNLESKLQKPR